MLIGAFLVPSMANAQTTSHYGAKVGSSGANLVGFDLTVYSPDNQTVYNTTLPLVFNISWIYGLIFEPNAILFGNYSYQIDNNQPINIPSNQKSESYLDFEANQSFSIAVDISYLASGKHQLVIVADLEYCFVSSGPQSVFEQATSPITFTVDNPTPTPTSTILPTSTTKTGVSIPSSIISTIGNVGLVLIVVVVITLITLLLYRRNRKITKPNQCEGCMFNSLRSA